MSGQATPEETAALEQALKEHAGPGETKSIKSLWAAPTLRKPLPRKA